VYLPQGTVGMSTQSGALGLAILDYAKQLNIGISSFMSVGNKADVSGNDLLILRGRLTEVLIAPQERAPDID